jgi:hypothetical protein
MTDMHSSETRRSVIDPPPHRASTIGQFGKSAGRTLGARNRAALAAQAILDEKVEAITLKATEPAENGDFSAIRLCLGLVVPPRREQPIEFEIRKLEWIDDARQAIGDVIAAVAAGKITLTEAAEVTRLLEAYMGACEASQRSSELEDRAIYQRKRRERRELDAGSFSLTTRRR